MVKRKSLREVLEETVKKNPAKKCTPKKRCATLEGVLAAANVRHCGLMVAIGMDGSDTLVLYTDRAQFIIVNYCPFCGEKCPVL